MVILGENSSTIAVVENDKGRNNCFCPKGTTVHTQSECHSKNQLCVEKKKNTQGTKVYFQIGKKEISSLQVFIGGEKLRLILFSFL